MEIRLENGAPNHFVADVCAATGWSVARTCSVLGGTPFDEERNDSVQEDVKTGKVKIKTVNGCLSGKLSSAARDLMIDAWSSSTDAKVRRLAEVMRNAWNSGAVFKGKSQAFNDQQYRRELDSEGEWTLTLAEPPKLPPLGDRETKLPF